MADLPLPLIGPQIREKTFRQQEIELDPFTDEELHRYRFGRESIKYLVEILKNDLQPETDELLSRQLMFSPTTI